MTVLPRIMSGVVVLVSIMLVLTYGKSRRRRLAAYPICGAVGTLPIPDNYGNIDY